MTTSRNPFDALGEDYDPSAVAAPKSAPVKEEPKEVSAKQTTSKKRDPTRQSAGESRRNGEQSSRGASTGRGGRTRGPQNANEEFSKDKSVGHDANASKSTEDSVARGTARGRGRGRGSGTRREFDRRSATGKTDTPKATEQAWGNEAEAQQTATAEPTDSHDPAAPEPVEAETPAPIEEEEDNTVSYEEYLKQKAQTVLSFSAPSIREANEGSDGSKWGNEALTKENNEEAYYPGVQKSKSGVAKERKQKETLTIEQKFYQAPSTRGRGESRGDGRGRGRGGRGRGEGRGRGAPRGASRGASNSSNGGSKPTSAGLTLSDENAFPSL